MADPYRPSRDYREGYDEGYKDGFQAGWLGASAPQPRYPSGPGPSAGGTRRKLAPRYEKIVRPKKRRKTAYQSAYSAAYKRLKKKHPRMSFGSLSKKAHAAARKKVK